jgi:CRISPR-associated protein Cas2
MDVLITYDVATATVEGQRRLARVAKVCEAFGVRVQYSVFECRLSGAGLERLRAAIAAEIDPGQDSIRIYRFPGSLIDSVETIGNERQWQAGASWIV